MNTLPESDRLPRLREKFEELHDGAHSLRLALDAAVMELKELPAPSRKKKKP